AVQVAQLLELLDDAPPAWKLLGTDVVRAPLGLEARHDARSSARNGLRASSSPSVVIGPCPGYTTVSAGNVSASDPVDARRGSQSPPARSVRPTEPAKRTSPEKRQPSAW